MLPATKSDVLRELTEIWGDGPEAQIGEKILHFISEHLNSRYLPLSSFFSFVGSKSPEEKRIVVKVVNYFSGAGIQLLDLQFEYIDEEDSLLLDAEQAQLASERKINPITGDFDADLHVKLFVCFAPSEVARRALVK